MRVAFKSGIMLIALALAIILVQQAFAEAGLRAGLSFGDVDLREAVTGSPDAAEDVPSFSIADRRGRISIADAPRIQTSRLVFSSHADYSGYYYENEVGELEKLGAAVADGELIELKINNVDYSLSYHEALAGLLPDVEDELLAEADTLGVPEDEALFALGGADDTITIEDKLAGVVLLPVSGGSAIAMDSAGEISALDVLPDALLFTRVLSEDESRSMAEAERRAAETAGVEGEAEAGAAAGCEDFDADEGDDDIFRPSYVKVVNDEGAERITADYCAASGDISMLYEAECTGSEAKVRRIECPAASQCVQGACTSPAAAEKYCIDSDMIRNFSTELKESVQRKGTTVGFYAATIVDGGREFGAWGDYCSDDTTLIEYYCPAGARVPLGVFREVVCPNGCESGKCEEPPYCFDTDGGKYENVAGTVRGINAAGEYFTHTDSCKDALTVTEYACIPGLGCSANTECEGGGACVDGVCTAGVCAAPEGKSNGQACYANEQCSSDFCDMRRLVCADAPAAPVKADGESCTYGDYCSSGYCCLEAGQCSRPELYNKCASPPGGRSNGQPCYSKEQCSSDFCDMSRLVCAPRAPIRQTGQGCANNAECATGYCGLGMDTDYLSNGFASYDTPCSEGKHCDSGKCVEGAAEEPAAACNRCDSYNPFNIKEGTSCTPAGTPTAWQLERCPSGKYCNNNDCARESIASVAGVTAAFERRKEWAEFLDNTLKWLEDAKGIEPPSGKEIEDELGELANDFNELYGALEEAREGFWGRFRF